MLSTWSLVSAFVPALVATLAVAHVPALPLSAGLLAGEPFTAQSYDDARAAATSAGKLFLVDATAEWCGPCKRMKQTTWSDAAVRKALADSAVAFQLDVDEDKIRARELGIAAMPTVIVFRDGRELGRQRGYMAAAAFLSWFEGFTGSAGQDGALEAEHERLLQSDDPVARMDFGYGLITKARDQKSERLFELAELHLLWAWEWRDSHPGERQNDLAMLSEWVEARASYAPMPLFQERLQQAGDALSEPEHTSWRNWWRWFELSAAIDADASVLAWYDRVAAEDGHLELSGVTPELLARIRGQLFEVLLRRARPLDATRLGIDLTQRGREALAGYRNAMQSSQLDMLTREQRADLVAAWEGSLRKQLALLYGLASIAQQDALAAGLSRMLIDELDDGRSRVALVQRALDLGAASRPEHGVWLEEAAADGQDVSKLKARLKSARG